MQQNAEFHTRVEHAIANGQIKASFRSAMDGLMAKRKAAFPDPDVLEMLRHRGAQVRANSLSKLPELLERLEKNCHKNGIQVHWAETIEEANNIVLTIMQNHQAELLIKGKSMVSEEMELNQFLEQHGIECIESDLGEYILQLAGEPPSHIVAPAIHKSRQQIAHLFNEKFPDIPYSDDVDRLTRNTREILRKKFYAARVGLSGVNFAVAETGTLCLVENEGNGRMCTTVPPVHIAVTGIEKVVEKLEHIPPLLKLLCRSATGQAITTYFNMITSPRKPGEKDGPEEIHLVLLDNGRSRIYEDDELITTLRCIRCGACMNHCPVYARIGGHAYGSTIPGPIGSILEPQKAGLDKLGDLPTASTLCGACAEVCPVQIPIPKLLNRLRYERTRNDHTGATLGQSSGRTVMEAGIWRSWSWVHSQPRLYRTTLYLITRLRKLLPQRIGPWTQVRKAPQIAPKTLHELALKEGFNDK
ncbi:MAG: iron-sulfur cluster-binding protein [Candidatus Thiodiazotropha sp. (ex Codakia rugifera)]|nr:iron-sulfur cluster-binding protein [Candidatus Thiodiazotropha sp. (ex Codakia rugifera)]